MGNLERVNAAWIEAFNAHDENRIGEVIGERAVFRAPGPVHLEGRDDILEYTMGWLNAFPDGKVETQRTVVSGDWIAQEYTFSGTHSETLRGPNGDIPATGRRLETQVADFSRIANGKVVETYLYFDQVEVLTQLGLMPELARA